MTDHQFLLHEDALWDEHKVLAAFKSLEENSSHPIGKAVVGFCRATSKTGTMKVKHVEEVAGKGMLGSFGVDNLSDAIKVLAGNEAYIADHGISLDNTTSATLNLWKDQAKSVVIVAVRSALTSERIG